MEVLRCDDARIYPQMARREPYHDKIINSKSLFGLFSRTIESEGVSLPFQVRFTLTDDISVPGIGRISGIMIPYPYYLALRLSDDPELAEHALKFTTGPMYGVHIMLSNQELNNPKANGLQRLINHPSYNPRLLTANFMFFHEWGHVIQLARQGFSYESVNISDCQESCIIPYCQLDSIGCIASHQADNECEEFAKTELGAILTGEQKPVINLT